MSATIAQPIAEAPQDARFFALHAVSQEWRRVRRYSGPRVPAEAVRTADGYWFVPLWCVPLPRLPIEADQRSAV